MFPSALGVSTFAAEAQSLQGLVRQKGQITPALSIVPARVKNQLDPELPAQSLQTNQSTAQQHERHATVWDAWGDTHVDGAR